MPIGKRCNYCHKTIPVGKKCSCRNTKRYKEKKTDDVYIDYHWSKLRSECIKGCFGIDIFAFYNDNNICFGYTVHHIYPVEDYPKLAFDLNNLIYLTEQNHRLIHSMMEQDFEGTVRMLKEIKQRFVSEFNIGGG